jgi:hypothetical protein
MNNKEAHRGFKYYTPNGVRAMSTNKSSGGLKYR